VVYHLFSSSLFLLLCFSQALGPSFHLAIDRPRPSNYLSRSFFRSSFVANFADLFLSVFTKASSVQAYRSLRDRYCAEQKKSVARDLGHLPAPRAGI
jgi:hypothetical protein